MELLQLRHSDFFDTFEGDFSNQIFRSRINQFYYEGIDTLLSIKMALDLPEIYYVGDRQYVIRGGTYCVINPKDKVISEQNSKITIDGISIFISDATVREVWDEYHANKWDLDHQPCYLALPEFHEIVTPLMHDALGRFLAPLWNPKNARAIRTPDYFYRMIEHLLQVHLDQSETLKKLPVVKPSTRIELMERMHLGMGYIHDNIKGALTVKEIASTLCMTEYRFIRLFRALHGITPYQYILHRKMALAAQLLEGDSHSIAEIAAELGFGDTSAFGKRYRAITGLSPNSYRLSRSSG